MEIKASAMLSICLIFLPQIRFGMLVKTCTPFHRIIISFDAGANHKGRSHKIAKN